MNIVPAISSKGVYTLAAPFTGKVLANVPYTCTAVRLLTDLLNSSEDPYNDYYSVNSIDQTKFDTDVKAGVSIITLQSGSGELVSVPSSYITTYPKSDGLPYTAVIIAVSLGTIPNSLDLSELQTALVQTTKDVTGINAATKPVIVSQTTLVPVSAHTQLETMRKNRITLEASLQYQLTDVKKQLANRQAYIEELELYITSRFTVPTPGSDTRPTPDPSIP